jgi:hypothetical protein
VVFILQEYVLPDTWEEVLEIGRMNPDESRRIAKIFNKANVPTSKLGEMDPRSLSKLGISSVYHQRQIMYAKLKIFV